MEPDEQRRATKREKSRELAARLGTFGGEVLKSAEQLDETKITRHVRDQLVRSASAAGAHYAEARSAQSRKDFVHKAGLAAKEAREALHWLWVAKALGAADDNLSAHINEADELVAILYASVQTARGSGSYA